MCAAIIEGPMNGRVRLETERTLWLTFPAADGATGCFLKDVSIAGGFVGSSVLRLSGPPVRQVVTHSVAAGLEKASPRRGLAAGACDRRCLSEGPDGRGLRGRAVSAWCFQSFHLLETIDSLRTNVRTPL